MSLTVVYIFSFIAVSILVVGIGPIIYKALVSNRGATHVRLRAEFHAEIAGKSAKSPLFKDLKRLAGKSEDAKPDFLERFDEWIEQSGLVITPDRLLIYSAVTGIVVGLLTVVLSHSLWGAFAGLLVGCCLPPLYIQMRRARRINTLRNQLPEAFDLMSRAIQAGQSIATAFQVVADDMEDPIAEEFACCHEQQNLGLPQDIALRDLARRTGVMEVQMFSVTLLLQRQTGGNPVEMLSSLADTIRKRISLLGKVKALTGESRMQAIVLLGLPPLLFVVMLFLNPVYMQKLIDRPMILLATIGSEALGALWIQKIISFKF